MTPPSLAPVAETSFSHRLTAYKIVGHFFALSYLNISGNNQVENRFFRISNISVPCPHAQCRGRTVIETLWTFFGRCGQDRSLSLPCWFFRVKQIHQSSALEGTTRLCRPNQIWFSFMSRPHTFMWSLWSCSVRSTLSLTQISAKPKGSICLLVRYYIITEEIRRAKTKGSICLLVRCYILAVNC